MPDITWNLTDDTTTYTFDGASSSSDNVTVGEEFTVTLFLEPGGASGGHIQVYNAMLDYDKYLTDRTLDYGTTYEGEPWYRFTINPNASVSTYLFKVAPGTDVDGVEPFWGLLTDVTDNTRVVGAGEELQMKFYVLADTDTYSTRTDVQNALESDL